MKLKPGLHAGIPFIQYLDVDAMNNSTLKLFNRTAAHGHYDMTHPPPDKAAFRTGDATHVAILEPERFEKEYVRAPKFDRRTNKGNAAAAKWAEDHPHHVSLLTSEWDLACGMRDSVWSHPLARDLLAGKGANELTVVWNDPDTAILCKGRIDRLTSYRDWTMAVDIKTTRSVEDFSWRSDCAKYGYHQQAAFYLDGLDALAPHKRRFIHVAVEKESPHCVRVFELDDSAIEEGRRKYRRALEMYAEGLKSGEWPGYDVGIEGVDIPRWAYELGEPSW